MNLEPWLAEYVDHRADDIARLITERVQLKLRGEEKLRGFEADRLRVTVHDRTAIASLPLPTRLTKALQRGGVETLGDLNGITEDDIRRWRHVGQASLDHLRTFLALVGRSLPFQRPAEGDARCVFGAE